MHPTDVYLMDVLTRFLRHFNSHGPPPAPRQPVRTTLPHFKGISLSRHQMQGRGRHHRPAQGTENHPPASRPRPGGGPPRGYTASAHPRERRHRGAGSRGPTCGTAAERTGGARPRSERQSPVQPRDGSPEVRHDARARRLSRKPRGPVLSVVGRLPPPAGPRELGGL